MAHKLWSFLAGVAFACLQPLSAAATEVDSWPGTHTIVPAQGGDPIPAEPKMQVIASIAPSADTKQLPASKENNLKRWLFTSLTDGKDGEESVFKPFLPKGYEEFGWVQLHAAGQMECLELGAWSLAQRCLCVEQNRKLRCSLVKSRTVKNSIQEQVTSVSAYMQDFLS